MKKTKEKRIEVIVEGLSDYSVGMIGGTDSFVVEMPMSVFKQYDEEEQREIIEDIKKLAISIVDPDGSAMTVEEIEAENAMYEKMMQEE
jgi:hypothetical protein